MLHSCLLFTSIALHFISFHFTSLHFTSLPPPLLGQSDLIQHLPMLTDADQIVRRDGSRGGRRRDADSREGVISAQEESVEGSLVTRESMLAGLHPRTVRSVGPPQKSLVRQRGGDLHRPRNGPLPRVRYVFLDRAPQKVGRLLLLLPVLVGISIHALPPFVRFGGGNVGVQHVLPLGGQRGIDQGGHGAQHYIPGGFDPPRSVPIPHDGPLGRKVGGWDGRKAGGVDAGVNVYEGSQVGYAPLVALRVGQSIHVLVQRRARGTGLPGLGE
mmetsp:Transcript_30372/g.90569  ORF Transcript_30372/g.90569 Transcript_30372/m.90569 type:complete len:271 (+) Transcript_30372:337-1149(+)